MSVTLNPPPARRLPVPPRRRTVRSLVTMAVALARDPERLAAIRAKLGVNRTSAPLFDTPRFARDIEAIYAKLAGRQRMN